MKCLKCSAEIEGTIQACPNCGLRLISKAFKEVGFIRRAGLITFFSVWNLSIWRYIWSQHTQ